MTSLCRKWRFLQTNKVYCSLRLFVLHWEQKLSSSLPPAGERNWIKHFIERLIGIIFLWKPPWIRFDNQYGIINSSPGNPAIPWRSCEIWDWWSGLRWIGLRECSRPQEDSCSLRLMSNMRTLASHERVLCWLNTILETGGSLGLQFYDLIFAIKLKLNNRTMLYWSEKETPSVGVWRCK